VKKYVRLQLTEQQAGKQYLNTCRPMHTGILEWCNVAAM